MMGNGIRIDRAQQRLTAAAIGLRKGVNLRIVLGRVIGPYPAGMRKEQQGAFQPGDKPDPDIGIVQGIVVSAICSPRPAASGGS